MEIQALSDSWINDFWKYTWTRIPFTVFAPLVAFLLAAAYASYWPENWTTHLVNLVLAMSFLIQFRLWDDLSDMAEDRVRHPERILCSTSHLAMFRILVFALFIANVSLIVLAKPIWMIVVFLILNATFLVFYWLASKRNIPLYYRYHFVLIKYPIFVIILGTGDSWIPNAPLLYAAALVYIGLCIYELLDDDRLAKLKGSKFVFGTEFAIAFLIGLLMYRDLSNSGFLLAYALIPILVAGVALSATVLSRRNPWSQTPLLPSAAFLLFLIWIFVFALAKNGQSVEQTIDQSSASTSSPMDSFGALPNRDLLFRGKT